MPWSVTEFHLLWEVLNFSGKSKRLAKLCQPRISIPGKFWSTLNQSNTHLLSRSIFNSNTSLSGRFVWFIWLGQQAWAALCIHVLQEYKKTAEQLLLLAMNFLGQQVTSMMVVVYPWAFMNICYGWQYYFTLLSHLGKQQLLYKLHDGLFC